MFAKFARFISRYWIAVLVAWVVIPGVLYLVAPKWDEITHDGDFAYLPKEMKSVCGGKLLEEAFPDLASKSSVVLVVARPDSELADDDKDVAMGLADMFTPRPDEMTKERLKRWFDHLGVADTLLPKPDEKTPVASIMTHKDQYVGSKLRSPNGRSVLVLLQLNNEFMAVDNMPFIKEVYRKVREIRTAPGFPAGLQLGVTGSAAVGSDLLWSQKESIDRTEWTTILLVTVILLIVYRSPGLVLVPLVSIGVSFFASLNLIALVAQWADRHQELVGTVRPLAGPAAIRLPGFHDDPYLHRGGAFRGRHRLLPVPHRPIPRGTRARPGAAGRFGRSPGANGARLDRQRDDDDPGAGSDDLCRLRQVPFRRPHDRHFAGCGPLGLHDRGPGHAAGLRPAHCFGRWASAASLRRSTRSRRRGPSPPAPG